MHWDLGHLQDVLPQEWQSATLQRECPYANAVRLAEILMRVINHPAVNAYVPAVSTCGEDQSH
jgi:hypothetical protein